MTLSVKCPTCGKSVALTDAEAFRPFCGERCRLIDLGEWATQSYVIPGDPEENQTDSTAELPLHSIDP